MAQSITPPLWKQRPAFQKCAQPKTAHAVFLQWRVDKTTLCPSQLPTNSVMSLPVKPQMWSQVSKLKGKLGEWIVRSGCFWWLCCLITKLVKWSLEEMLVWFLALPLYISTLFSVPCSPTNVSVFLDCPNNSAVVSWSASRGAVQYSVTAISSHLNDSCQTSGLTCRLSLACGSLYTVQVVAMDDNCSSIPSSPVAFSSGERCDFTWQDTYTPYIWLILYFSCFQAPAHLGMWVPRWHVCQTTWPFPGMPSEMLTTFWFH